MFRFRRLAALVLTGALLSGLGTVQAAEPALLPESAALSSGDSWPLPVDFDSLSYDTEHVQDFLSDCEDFQALLYSSASITTISTACMALYVDYLSLYTEYSVCSVHYYRDPASYEADYLAFTFLFTRAGQAYQDAVHGMFRSDSFTDAYAAADGDLEELEELLDDYLDESITDEQLDLMDQESALVAGYWNALTAEYTATLPGSDRTWTREETESDPDLSDEDYWTLLSALAQARTAAAGPYLLELSSLRREIARSSGYDSVLDYYYETYYGRDYGREESEALFSYVKEHIVPVYSAYAAYYAAVCAGEEALNRYDGQGQAGKLAAVGPVIGQIASELGELFDYMVESNLCDIERSDTKLDVGFTISLPSYRSAFLFDSPQGGYYDISTLIHEFGHFSAYCAAPSVNFSYDTAETHSQGLEALSLRYADQLFGEAGDAFRGADLYALLHAVVDGCLYGEFQVEFFDMEDPTLQDVNRLFRTLAQEYGYVYATDSDEAYDWVEVNHTFESPFYYISYATSALSALDLFLTSQDDYQGAVDTYLNLIRLSDESGYRETMARAGFPDVFQEETVSGVGGELSGYLYTDLYGLYDLEDHWALPEIGALVSAGLIGGTGDGFQPSVPVSRAALCTILYRAEGQPQPDAESSFSDVAADAWYADAASWAAESGITTGTGGGFSPDVPLTRESLALLLYRYAGEPSHSGGLSSFSDADTVSPWASQAVAWAVEQGILLGSDGRLNPTGGASRTEAAVMLFRFFSQAAGEAAA